MFFSVNHVVPRFLELDLELVNTEHPDGQVGFDGGWIGSLLKFRIRERLNMKNHAMFKSLSRFGWLYSPSNNHEYEP